MKKLIAIALALAALTAHATQEDPNWGIITKVEGGLAIHGRYNSFEYVDNVGFLVVRFTSKDKINFYIAAVSNKSCDAGFGEVGFFDTNYKPLRKESYVNKGGNGIAAIGDLICYLINKKRSTDL